MRTLSRPYYLAAVLAASMLVATCARADGMQDSLENCLQLQNGPLPISCGMFMREDTPVFVFGLWPGVEKAQLTLAMVSVIRPICLEMPIRVIMAAKKDGKLAAAFVSTCTDGRLSEFEEMDVSSVN